MGEQLERERESNTDCIRSDPGPPSALTPSWNLTVKVRYHFPSIVSRGGKQGPEKTDYLPRLTYE